MKARELIGDEKICLITCDAEQGDNQPDTLRILQNLCTIARVKGTDSHILIFKVYANKSGGITEILALLFIFYTSVEVYTSVLQGQVTDEAYLVCSNS